jgi:alkylhydroperoxidase family enzyme
MTSNDRAGILVKQPRLTTERVEVARKCCSSLGITMPMVIDEMSDLVGHLYSGMPDRLYVLDSNGRVAYKGGRGPFGFKSGEMEQSLAMLLMDEQAQAKPAQCRVPLLPDEEAWKLLPPAEKGADQPLPSWARALVKALPRTTAAMLELDYLQRAKSPLDPKLRGKLRWVAANANRCAYSEAYALADLRRAGLTDAELKVLQGDRGAWPDEERAALVFARKLTLAADTVSDDELAGLIKKYGDKQVVAVVLLLADANFQDRLLLTLDVPLEEGGPRPPLEVRFKKDGGAEAPPRRTPDGKLQPLVLRREGEGEWSPRDFAQLQKQMDTQRERKGRISVPSWEEVKKQVPDGATRPPLRIRWSLVCVGYQPEMALGWSACTRNFGQEAAQDRVFEESLFWVVTRSLDCFY